MDRTTRPHLEEIEYSLKMAVSRERLMAIYKGSNFGDHFRFGVWKDRGVLSPRRSLQVRNHSPDGFSWGYEGSGPAQLALGLLLEETDEQTARARYMKFKSNVVAGWPMNGEWETTSEEIKAWLVAHGGYTIIS